MGLKLEFDLDLDTLWADNFDDTIRNLVIEELGRMVRQEVRQAVLYDERISEKLLTIKEEVAKQALSAIVQARAKGVREALKLHVALEEGAMDGGDEAGS